jgi:hypothetical protein
MTGLTPKFRCFIILILNIMSVYFTLYLVALFFVLTPGVLVTLPPKSGKLTVAVTHALVFAVVYQLTHKMVAEALEGFQNTHYLPKGRNCKSERQCISKKCINNICM